MDAVSNEEPTGRPSAGRLFVRYVGFGIMSSGFSRMTDWYPYGPISAPSGSVNWRLSMKETDWLLRCMVVCTVTNENMATV